MLGVEEAYSRLAAQYDELRNRTRDLDALVLREHGPNTNGKVVLELGCGTGKNTIWLADKSRAVIALDLSEPMLERARVRAGAPHVEFLRCDLREPWPVSSGHVDLVVANLVLEHVEDVDYIFSEMRRVLGRGGEVFSAELHPYRQVLGRGLEIPGVPAGSVEAYRHTISEYVNSALRHGFSVLRLGEWSDRQDRAEDAPPRLFSLHLRV